MPDADGAGRFLIPRIRLPEDQPNFPFHEDNVVRTTKYTLLTWLPVSICMQFRKLANVYFLIVTCISMFDFSPKSWFSFAGTFSAVEETLP